MHHHKLTALLLAAALTASLCAGTVLAGGDEPDASAGTSQDLLIAPAPAPADEPSGGETAETSSAEPADETASTRAAIIVDGQSTTQDVQSEDPAGTLSFQNLEARIKANNLTYRALDESANSIDAIDYKEMKANLNTAIQMLRGQQTQLSESVQATQDAMDGLQTLLDAQAPGINVTGFTPALTAYPTATITALGTQIATYQATLKQLEDGVIQDQAEAGLRQLGNAKRQVILGGQTLYIALLGLDQTSQSLQRQLDSLDRTIEELELRYDMGQISSLTLAEAKAGRTSLLSGIQTLDMNRTALKRQLEAMVGADITGTIQLQPLTAVTAEQIQAMDLEKDMEKGAGKSYDLYAARQAVYTADDDLLALYRSDAADYEIDSAQYTVDAAELSLDAAEQTFELGFRSLYDTVHDQMQILNAARTALAVKEDQLAVSQLKYEQGTISRNALLSARDARDDAQDTVDTAAVDLFTAYNNYCWAVEHGILN